MPEELRSAELEKHTEHILVHTGQNYDYELNEIFFKDLKVKKPDYFLDSTGDLWASNALENIPGIVFTSTGSMHGGQEMTEFNLLTYMLHHGMIILGSPYSIQELNETKSGGTPYGPSHVESFNNSNKLTPHEYEISKLTGSRIAKFINKFNDQ